MPVCFGLYGKGLIMGKLMIPDYVTILRKLYFLTATVKRKRRRLM